MPIETFSQVIKVNTTPQVIKIETIKKELIINSGGSFNFNFAGNSIPEILPIISNNQTSFVLSKTVTIIESTQVFLNGIKQIYGIDYNIDSAISTLFWLGIALELTDYLEIYY